VKWYHSVKQNEKENMKMNLIKKVFHLEKPTERQTTPKAELSTPARISGAINATMESPKMKGNIMEYCDYYRIALFVGDEKSDYDLCARMRSKSEEEEFVIETITKRGLYRAVSPYLGDCFVDFDTQITYPGKRSLYAMGGNIHVSNGYAFRECCRLVSGEMCGPKNWRHFDMGDNYDLPMQVIAEFKPAIDLVEHLCGRTLIRRESMEKSIR
jgi:hypothetical protein